MSDRLTPEREADLAAIAERATAEPFFVSDCEGELQVWRENALTHVRRDESGQITMYSFPSTYRVTDEVIRIDLDTWDEGEDATDDQRRQDIGDLTTARAAMPSLLAELAEARAALREAANQIAAQDDAIGALTAERAALTQRLHDASMTRTWRNEDGKKFVFVEDLAPALLGKPKSTP